MSSVIIVGGGLAGLSVGALLRQAGVEVLIIERASEPGGRARTQTHAGAAVNLGPHALYRKGAGARVLKRLGVNPKGAVPANSGLVLRGGALHALPGDAASFFGTTLFTGRDRLSVLGVLSAITAGFEPDPALTVRQWIAPMRPAVADFVSSFVRVTSYANAPDAMPAVAAVRQIRRGLGGVTYLDGGWKQLVDALSAGQEIHHAEVVAADPSGVTLATGERLIADAVVIATLPAEARKLGVAVPELTPARAACLDLVLERCPAPEARFVLGADQPLYLSNHGAVADLGGVVLHVMRYLAPGETGDVGELEELLDLAQPGWRELVRFRRFLPALTVAGSVSDRGRPGFREPGGLYLAGDWVGDEGLLADASFASAEAAADHLIAALAGQRAAA